MPCLSPSSSFRRPLYPIIWMILALASPLAAAELPLESPAWRLHTDLDGIRIYMKDQPNSDVQAFKAIAVLAAPLENLMAVMANPLSCPEWVHGCVESRGFDETSFTHRYGYSVNDLPWPVQDRDSVLFIHTSNNPDSGTITIDMWGVADKLPKQDGLVRIHQAESRYIFRSLDDTTTEVTWLQHAEPGGSIPTWLVNALLVDLPMKSLQALEKIARTEKYQGFQILYDDQRQITGVAPR